MGSYQSKPDMSAQEKAVARRLGSLKLDDDAADDGYVHVGEKAERREGPVVRSPEGLPVQLLSAWQRSLLHEPKNRLALSAFSGSDPRAVLRQPSALIEDQQVFNVKIPFEGSPITNQRASGRCWLFAATNVFRVAIMQRYELESFELSQAYLFFWDKLEKANFFLENILDTADEDLDSRLVQRILAEPVSDGGQWDMVYNLVEKYGLVPQALYPDNHNASNSGTLNYIVVTKLREYGLTLRKLARDPSSTATSLSSAKLRMMRDIQLMLVVTLGAPPSATDKFEWTFQDKHGKARTVTTTPHEFALDISSPAFRLSASTIAGFVSLVHDPRHDPFTVLTVDRLGNVVGGRGVGYVNVPIATLKQHCVAALKAGYPVFFGSDVLKFSDTASGVMDLALFDYAQAFDVGLLGLSKADRLRVGDSAMTHAMVLTGVHLDDRGRSVRWRVQNSWGEGAGHKGWFVMTDEWMDEWVYQAVIHPRFLTDEVKRVLKQEPVVLPLWDPMGALA